jgi:hypothetical protein
MIPPLNRHLPVEGQPQAIDHAATVNGRTDGFAGGTAQRPDTADRRSAPGPGSCSATPTPPGTANPAVTAHLGAEQLAECFATDLHQANLGVIWERLGI